MHWGSIMTHTVRQPRSTWLARLSGLLLALAPAPAALAFAPPAQAQTDYYNTDAGRPLRIEDAYTTERYAFELQLAPMRIDRTRGGEYSWSMEP
jgi:hypothetical protein